MKTMKKTMIAIAILLMANLAYSSGKVRMNVEPAANESAFVEISNALTEIEIDVKNELGDVIFYKKLTEPTTSYKRKYDFSALEDGEYTLSVNSDNELNETRFKIERGELTIIKERKLVEPFIKNEGNIWKMSYLNFPMENMNLYVFDRSNLLYQKKVDPVFAVHEGLDLSKLQPGNYQIVFTNGNSAFEYEVKVK